IKAKKKKYKEIKEALVSEIKETSVSNKLQDISMPKDLLGQTIDYENTNNYQPLYKLLVEVLDGFDIDALMDSKKSNITEISLNEVLENSNESDFTNIDVLEYITSNFKASFNNFIKYVLQEIKRLKNGLVIETLIGDAWVVGKVRYITANLLQENDLADVK
ncbi:33310_t:CDS:2, partial [Racocetra persica]